MCPGAQFAALAAFDNDQFAAAMLLDPLPTQLLAQPDQYQIVQDFRTLEYPPLCVTMRRDGLKANEAPARTLLAAIVRTKSEPLTAPAEARSVARDKLTDNPPATLEAAVTRTLPRLS